MQPEFPSRFLRCPHCHRDGTLELQTAHADPREVREGTLTCQACANTYPVERGAGLLLPRMEDHVAREVNGLHRFADVMIQHGWTREKVLELPYIAEGYWYVQAISFQQMMDAVNPQPGQSVVDIGSNTCWAANRFAEMGLDTIALDISTAEFQGLFTADFYLEAGRGYFERIQASMTAMPIASATLDYVFCCEVLHHNDLRALGQTLREAYRVLKPGGKLLVVNETLKRVTDPSGVHLGDVEQFEGNEHAHWAVQYRGLALRAGFRQTELLYPIYHPFFQYGGVQIPSEASTLGAFRRATEFAIHHNSVSRRAFAAWLTHVKGPAQYTMVATKPG